MPRWKAFRRLSLGAQLFWAMLVSFGLILAVHLVLDARQTHEEFHRLEKQTLAAFIPGLGKMIDDAMLREDRKHIDEVFERIRRNGPFSSLELLDSQRRVVRTRDFALGGRPGRFASKAAVPEHYTEVEFPLEKRPSCVRCHAGSGNTLGYVRIVAPLERARGMLGRHLRARLAFGFLALTLAGLCAAAALRSIVQVPMRRIVRALDSVNDTGAQARLTPDLPGEFSVIAAHFNAMVERLHDNRREIGELHRRQVAHMDRLVSLGELGANFAHEVRNPLTGISSAIQVLRRDLPEEDAHRDVLSKVLDQVDRLNKTLDNFLHFSRMPQAHMRPFLLDEPLQHVLFLLEPRAKAQGARFSVELPSGLPPLHGDPSQIEQVLLNLCLNALQAVPQRGGEVLVRARPRKDAGALVEVRDNGGGIPPEILDKVFQPFFTTRREGSGLGLPIARQIVEAHEGKLWIESAPGGGASVFVSLPANALLS